MTRPPATRHRRRKDDMPARTAQTIWRGSIETGNGKVELASSHAGRYDVSFPRRTAERGGGTTSPEELIAARIPPAMPCSCPPSSAPRDEPAPIGGHRRCLSGSRPGRRLSTDRHQPDARRWRRGARCRDVHTARRRSKGRLPRQQSARGCRDRHPDPNPDARGVVSPAPPPARSERLTGRRPRHVGRRAPYA